MSEGKRLRPPIRTSTMNRIRLLVVAASAMVTLTAAPAASAALTLDGSSDRLVLKPEFTGSTCAPGVNGNECGVMQFTGLGPADCVYRYGSIFDPNGTRGCCVIDGTFTIILQSDASTISGPLSGVFCSLSGRRTPQAYGNPFSENAS